MCIRDRYLANVGDFDICGNRRPQSYYREIVWGLRSDPYIAVINPQYYECKAAVTNWSWSDSINSWTWYGYEDKPIEIEVYSNADEVKLYINGNVIAKKRVGEEKPYMAIFKTFYKEDGHYRLQPQNSSMEPIIVDNVEIIGKVISLFRPKIVS